MLGAQTQKIQDNTKDNYTEISIKKKLQIPKPWRGLLPLKIPRNSHQNDPPL